MPKVERINDQDGSPWGWKFFCPGCKCYHSFETEGNRDHNWQFNGDIEKPTFTPSLKVTMYNPKRVCHLSVQGGKIKYLSDCYHSLAEQTIEMEDVEPEGGE